MDSWENYDLNSKVLGGEDDKGDVLIVKSGTDFRDLSELSLEIEDVQDAGAVRKKVIRRATGTVCLFPHSSHSVFTNMLIGIHHEIKPGMRSCEKLQQILGSVLQSVDSSLGSPLCKLATQLDVRSQFIRVEEVLHFSILSGANVVLMYSTPMSSRPQGTGLRISCAILMMMPCT